MLPASRPTRDAAAAGLLIIICPIPPPPDGLFGPSPLWPKQEMQPVLVRKLAAIAAQHPPHALFGKQAAAEVFRDHVTLGDTCCAEESSEEVKKLDRPLYFNTLRRAKHSTMVLMSFLYYKEAAGQAAARGGRGKKKK